MTMMMMKKKTMTIMMLCASVAVLHGCSAGDDGWLDDVYGEISDGSGMGAGGASAASGELTTFTVDIDRTTDEPAATVGEYFPDEEDDLANNSFGTEVAIAFNGTTATCTAADGVAVTVDGAHVVADHGSTKGVCYTVSGQTDNGSLTIVGSKKYEVKLDGASITNPDSAALNLLSSKRAYVVLQSGTTNQLADGTASKAGHKAALYCKGKLLFNGGGSLEVHGNYNNGIHSADYIVFRQGNNVYVNSTANHGIKANDGIVVNGGILNVEVSALAAKGINSERDIVVNGGRVTVITTGTGTYDSDDGGVKGSAAIAADSTYTQNGGEVCLKSTGAGGKGLKTGYEAYLNGGKLCVITEGTRFTGSGDTASPKGVKIGTKNVHGVLQVSDGTVMVRTKGTGGEGLESKGTIAIGGGTVMVSAYDDAVNSAGDMTISGGNVVAVGTANDGLDANGNMYIQGGSVVAYGASGAETGIDIDERHALYITGGSIFGIGGRIDASLGSTTQAIVSTSGSVSAGATVTIADGSTAIASFTMPPYNYSNGTIMLSAPGLASGGSYTLSLGDGGSQSVTASATLSSGMGGGMQPGGGGRPGGRSY